MQLRRIFYFDPRVRGKYGRNYRMILVGGGALLSRAARYAKQLRLRVDLACCPPGDASRWALKEIGIPLLETSDPNADLPSMLEKCSDGVAFSINNRYILRDELLCAGVSFFNVHSGLVQKYRGLSEVCVFAALCGGEQSYGVTLHRILPGQRVDAGPVISQLQFKIADNDGFEHVLTNCLYACQKIFESNASQIVSKNFKSTNVEVSKEAYSYKNLIKLCRNADAACLSRASRFGVYATVFPKLKGTVESVREAS